MRINYYRLRAVVLGFFLIVIAAILAYVNYYLYSIQEKRKQSISELQLQLTRQEQENKLLRERNDYKEKEVNNLRSPQAFHIYEEKLRQDYGMIGKGETFFVMTENKTRNIPDVKGMDLFENMEQIGLVVPIEDEAPAELDEQKKEEESVDTLPPPPELKLQSIEE